MSAALPRKKRYMLSTNNGAAARLPAKEGVLVVDKPGAVGRLGRRPGDLPHAPLGDAELLVGRPGGGEPGAEAPEAALVGQVVVLVPERLRALGGRVILVLEAPAVDRVVAGVEVQGPELGVAGHL